MLAIIRIAQGKETEEERSENRSKLNDRLKQLRKATRKGVSGRGGKHYAVRYVIREV